MSNPRFAVPVIIASLVPCVVGLHLLPTAASEAAAPASNPVGTYFFESVTQSTQEHFTGFITLHIGGTVTWADTSDFGGGGFFNTLTHGVWNVSGPNEVTITGYYYRLDASGAPIVLVRITTVGSLVTGQATGTVDVFGANQNPATEAPAFPGADSLTLTTSKL